MVPLWIIDLEESDGSKNHLPDLIGKMPPRHLAYWYYTRLNCRGGVSQDTLPGIVETLVSEGQKCFNGFSQAGYVTGNFQIAILGNASQTTSVGLFASIAGLLRDCFHRIVSGHANRGVEITGFLFVSEKLNQIASIARREKIALLLESVNVLSRREGGANNYDRVIAYQEVQYSGNRYYAELDDDGRKELLFQYLVSCYMGDASKAKALDVMDKGSGGIFSMGSASVFYDSEYHKDLAMKQLLDPLIERFKLPFEEGDHDEVYSRQIVRRTFSPIHAGDPDPLSPEEICDKMKEGCNALDPDLRKLEGKPDPHPVWDLFKTELFPSYYRKYLKFMPARILHFLQDFAYALSVKFSREIRKNRERLEKSFKERIHGLYAATLPDPGCKFATIAQLESVFKESKEYFHGFRISVEREDREIVPVPEYLRADYERSRATSDETDDDAMRGLLDKLKKVLRNEPVILSDFVRCFLLGVVCVFTGIPLLRLLSPNVVNFGNVASYEWLWIVVLFLLPVTIEFLLRVRRHFKRVKRLKYRMLATKLFFVNKKLSRFFFDSVDGFYASLEDECDLQLSLLEQLRSHLVTGEVDATMQIPLTLFSQRLLDGRFQTNPMVRDEKDFEGRMRIDDRIINVSDLETKHLIWLLRHAFDQRPVSQAADLSGHKQEEMPEVSKGLLSAFTDYLSPMMSLDTADSAGMMVGISGRKIDLAPLFKMAGVNGMLFSNPSGNAPLAIVTDIPESMSMAVAMGQEGLEDYIFWITWQRLDSGLDARAICHCDIKTVPNLGFEEHLSLYYMYFRSRAAQMKLFGEVVHVSSKTFEEIDKLIAKGREGV